jgi:hypothetical protein
MNSGNYSPISSDGAAHELSLKHLYAEFARLDLMLQRQIARWRASGQDPTDAFRGLYISDQEASALMNRPLGGNWGDVTSMDESGFQNTLESVEDQVKAISNKAQAQNKNLRLQRIVDLFNLSAFEKNILLLALAPAMDLRYQRIYAYLQDDVTKKVPSVNMALELFSNQQDRITHLNAFTPDAALYRHKLLILPGTSEPLLSRPLQIDPAIPAWLLGHYKPDNLAAPQSTDLITDDQDRQIPIYDPKLIVSFIGPDRLAQAHF